MKRFNWSRSVPLMMVAGLLVFAACEDPQMIEAPQEEPLDSRLVIEDGFVFTPSGVVFTLEEWNCDKVHPCHRSHDYPMSGIRE